MDELEVKILEIERRLGKSVSAIGELLVTRGATKVFDGEIRAFYYDTPERILDEKKISLRLRKKGTLVELTYKLEKSKERVKLMDEREVLVSDFDKMHDLLEGLGYVVRKRIEKRRVSYLLDKTHFEFDTFTGKYAGVPTFLEIEAQTERDVERAVELVGCTMSDARPWSGKDVLKYYRKNGD